MQPESKVVSLETAKKLKESGFPQDTERYWLDTGSVANEDESYSVVHEEEDCGGVEGYIAAPDAQEIGELLPESIEDEEYWLTTFKCTRKGWWVVYNQSGQDAATSKNCKESIWSPSESEARAACWIYLKENKLI
jgi:hypothetical protein